MRFMLMLLPIVLVACGPSNEEINNTAIITSNIMGESRNMDAAMLIKEINAAREKIGADPFLYSDDVIKESFDWAAATWLRVNRSDEKPSLRIRSNACYIAYLLNP